MSSEVESSPGDEPEGGGSGDGASPSSTAILENKVQRLLGWQPSIRGYLQLAPILRTWDKKTGTAQSPIGVLLEGGVVAHGKLQGRQGGNGAIEAEAAAWEIARTMGYGHLVAATVLRDEIDATDIGEGVQPGSLQVDLPIWDTPPNSSILSERERWQAAVFDIVTGCTDRGEDGKNWNVVGPPGGVRLVLYDHGYSFRGDGIGTLFPSLKVGQHIPDEYLDDLRRLDGADLDALLQGLLRPDQIREVEGRVAHLLRAESVAIP